MTSIGSKDKFAVILGSSYGEMRAAEVWVGGKNLTSFDSSAYVPGFLTALTHTERGLKVELNFLRHEAVFFGLCVEEAFLKPSRAGSPELEQAWSHLRFDLIADRMQRPAVWKIAVSVAASHSLFAGKSLFNRQASSALLPISRCHPGRDQFR